MQIEIHIPRPGLLLLIGVTLSGWGVAWTQSGGTQPEPLAAQVTQQHTDEPSQPSADDVPANIKNPVPAQGSPAVGGDDTPNAEKIRQAELRSMQARAQQQLLREKQQVITDLLRGLEEERRRLPEGSSPELEEQFRTASVLLVSLLRDEKKAEQFILSTYNQIWEAEGKAVALGSLKPGHADAVVLEWPVEPLLGISAQFLSKEYRERFHFDHYGMDIPVEQGSPVHVAAGGIVRDVVDHGLGFSYVTVEHPGGYVTLYGHLSGFEVQPGQHVVIGDVLGSSGGRPGTRGAGFSTGPHLHFGLYMNGAAIDPSTYLPST